VTRLHSFARKDGGKARKCGMPYARETLFSTLAPVAPSSAEFANGDCGFHRSSGSGPQASCDQRRLSSPNILLRQHLPYERKYQGFDEIRKPADCSAGLLEGEPNQFVLVAAAITTAVVIGESAIRLGVSATKPFAVVAAAKAEAVRAERIEPATLKGVLSSLNQPITVATTFFKSLPTIVLPIIAISAIVLPAVAVTVIVLPIIAISAIVLPIIAISAIVLPIIAVSVAPSPVLSEGA
jgi:hypothetical protein